MRKNGTSERFRRRTRWLPWAAALVLAWSAAPQPALCAPQIDAHALARITTYGPNGGTTGTGFLVGSGYVVTAYHVVNGARRIDVMLDGRFAKDVNVVAVHPEADLALLSTPTGTSVANAYRTVEGPAGAPGALVYVHGLPLGFDNQLLVGRLTQSGYLQSQNWIDRHGQSLFRIQNLSLVPLDITSEPGVSGAPVLDEQGNVFGVFSGSLQAGGRGYSWAVPMAYARMGQMQAIGKPASQIAQWPQFVYLRPGLSLLRSLDQNSPGAQLARHCRESIDAYSQAWESQLDAAYHFSLKWSMVKPTFDSIVQAAKQYGARTQKDRLHFVWETVEAQADAFQKTQTEFEKSTARMMTACYSQKLLDSLLPREALATRENILFERKITNRVSALVDQTTRAQAAYSGFHKHAQSKFDEMMALGGAAETASEEEAVQRLLRATALMAETMPELLSSEHTTYISSFVQGAGAWAEIMEAVELRPWDREQQTYDYQDPSGIGLTLAGGWVAVDKELYDALSTPGKPFPRSVVVARFNKVGQISPIKAVASVSWRPAFPAQSLADAEVPGYRAIANEQWRRLQAGEGTTFADTKQFVQRRDTDLLLEMTGSGPLSKGREIRAYLGQLVTARGTASLTCELLTQDVDYTMCTQLTDSMRLPK